MANLSIVACGAPLAARAHDLEVAAKERGWEVTLLVTDAARAWLPDDAASGFRSPDAPKPPRPDAVVVCPLTFNTANKWALGIADTHPMSLLAECLGAGKPAVAVPMVNESLWGHPRWAQTLEILDEAGVQFVDPVSGELCANAVRSGTGQEVVEAFDPSWVTDLLRSPA